MKTTRAVLRLLAVSGALAGGLAARAGAPSEKGEKARLAVPGPAGELKAELISLWVDKPGPHGAPLRGPWCGTSLAFWIEDPDRRIVALDQQQCRLESFTDDKGTDLSGRGPGIHNQWSMLGAFHEGRVIRPGGYLLEVGGDSFPGPGATKVSLRAMAALRRGSGEKTLVEEDVPVASGRTIQIGSLPVSIEERHSTPIAKMVVSLVATEPLDAIKSVAFFNSKGDAIGCGFGMFQRGGRGLATQFGRDFYFAERAENVTLKITYFEKLETVKLPLNVEVGLGLGELPSEFARAPGKGPTMVNKLKADIFSLRIDKPWPRGGGPGRGDRVGTSLCFWIPDPEERLLRFEPEQSNLESLTDDKGTNLAEKMPDRLARPRSGALRGTGVSANPPGWSIEVGGERFPSPGATKIPVKATLLFRRPSSERTIEEKGVSIKQGKEIQVGSLAFRVQEFKPQQPGTYSEPFSTRGFGTRGNPAGAQTTFSLICRDPMGPMGTLKSAIILDANGREIQPQATGQSFHAGGLPGMDYCFAEKLDKVTFKITYYDKFETVTVPLEAETGLGF